MTRGVLRVMILLAVGVAIAATGVRTVRPGEQIVVRRFGRILEPAWGPGLHWGWPLGIARFDRVRTDEVRRLEVGLADQRSDPGAGEFLTGDLNLIRIQAVVQYRVSHPADWLSRAAGAEELLERVASSRISSALARRGIDQALREDRSAIGAEVVKDLSGAVQRHRLGVEVLAVSLTDARPPAEVAADFSAAQSSESLRDRRVHEARTQAETLIAVAEAQARALLDSARAEAHRRELTSRAQAQRFVSLLDQVGRSRALTVQRLYLDSMQSLLGGVRRTIIVPPGDAVDLTVLGLED